MNSILRERKYAINLASPKKRKEILSQLAAEVTNELILESLTPNEKTRRQAILIQTIKLYDEIDINSKIEDFEDRLVELEKGRNNATK